MEIGMPQYREMRHASLVHGDAARIADVSFDSSLDTSSKVHGRLFFPGDKSSSRPRGCLMHLHGGGFVAGTAKGQSDARLLRHATNCDLAVLSVDYRLSPEHAHPAALLDSVAAALWLDSPAGRAAARIGEKQPLLLVGESAGGTLAAGVLTRLRDEHGSPELFRAVAMTYGWYDLALTPFARAWGERRLLSTADELRWFRDHYVGPGFPPERLRDPDVSPLYAQLGGLPPALFSIGTQDALLEDSLFMYARWLASGNDATLRVYPGAAHGVGHFGPHQFTEQGEQVLSVLEAFYSEHL